MCVKQTKQNRHLYNNTTTTKKNNKIFFFAGNVPKIQTKKNTTERSSIDRAKRKIEKIYKRKVSSVEK